LQLLSPGWLVDIDLKNSLPDPDRAGAGSNLRADNLLPDDQGTVLLQALVEPKAFEKFFDQVAGTGRLPHLRSTGLSHWCLRR
jgi:hypothetical protein